MRFDMKGCSQIFSKKRVRKRQVVLYYGKIKVLGNYFALCVYCYAILRSDVMKVDFKEAVTQNCLQQADAHSDQ